MDPVTGLITLLGFSVASVVGLKLKKDRHEGFASVPGTESSDARSQGVYNAFASLVNPLTDVLLPVGSSTQDVNAMSLKINQAIGSMDANRSLNRSQTLELSELGNKYKINADSKSSLIETIRFCREAGKGSDPFSQISKTGVKFSDACGVCLTSGTDEEGKLFNAQQGLLLDRNAREEGDANKTSHNLPYPHTLPSLGVCTGAPDGPVFATNKTDFTLFKKRYNCSKNATLDPDHNCAVCYGEGNYSYVSPTADTEDVFVILLGIGSATISVKGKAVKTVTLSTTPIVTNLLGIKEGDSFGVTVTTDGQTKPTLYGYLKSTTPGGGDFIMPLNSLFVVDDITKGAPKTSTYYTFPSNALIVRRLVGGTGQTTMSLRGTLPFTFVEPSDFSSIDCSTGPYQTKTASLTEFAAGDPCFVKGSGPGNYSNECLRGVTLNEGFANCTNQGDLYKNPSLLNNVNGAPQSISQITDYIQNIISQDGIDPTSTKLCSGRVMDLPCDPFKLTPTLKFTGNAAGKKCLSYLYNNVGKTYSTPSNFINKTVDNKNIVCVPDGLLNPDTTGLAILSGIADGGYKAKKSIDAVVAYLNDQLSLATDETKNANTDPNRVAAIKNCFGSALSALPPDPQSFPTVIQTSCGTLARYVKVLNSNLGDAWMQIAQLVVIDKTGTNVALKKPVTVSSTYGSGSQPSNAVDGTYSTRAFPNIFHAGSPDSSQFFMVDLGSTYDITTVIYYNRSDCCSQRALRMRVQLLDANKQLLAEKYIDGAMQQTLTFLVQGAPATCKTSLPYVPPPPAPPPPAPVVKPMLPSAPPPVIPVPIPVIPVGSAPCSSLPVNYIPIQGKSFGTVNVTGDYTLAFTVKPTGLQGNWSSILHFSNGQDCCGFGNRCPGIWFWPGSTQLHIRIGDANDGNWGIDTNPIPMNQLTTVLLKCQGPDVLLTLNGVNYAYKQPSKRFTGSVTVYGSDPWYPPANAQITNLCYTILQPIVYTIYLTSFNSASPLSIAGTSMYSNNVLYLTTNRGGQAGSAYYKTKQNISKFTTTFRLLFQSTGADGATFVIQNASATALGGAGGGLGYLGIRPSVAIRFDTYAGRSGVFSTDLLTNGNLGADLASSGDLTSKLGLVNGGTWNLQVSITYDGTFLSSTIVNLNNPGLSYSSRYTVNIPLIVGSSTAWVGFTAGTGGATENCSVSQWDYKN